MQSTSSRFTRYSVAALLTLAILDLLLPYVTIAILFAVPLALLTAAGYARISWRATLAIVALTYAGYFLKYMLWSPVLDVDYFSFRLVNRTFVAGMICLVAVALEAWRQFNLSREAESQGTYGPLESDAESTLALLFGLPLVLVIAAIDFLLPGEFNVAVLYPIAQVGFALAGSRRELWLSTLGLVVLVVAGYVLGPEAGGSPVMFFWINRGLTITLLLMLATILHFRMGAIPRRAARMAY